MGGKKTKLFEFDSLEGKKIQLPCAVITGDTEGPDAVITAGIHGGEHCGVMAALNLFASINPADVRGTIKILTVCDVEAFESQLSSNQTSDKRNLNRCFPGKPKSSYTDELAMRIFDEIKGADYHLDLHSGAKSERTVPFAIYHRGRSGALNDRCHEIAYYFGSPNIVITEIEGSFKDKGTLYGEVYEKIGIPSAQVESGSLGMTDPASIKQITDGTLNVLKHFGTLTGQAAPGIRPQIFESMVQVHTKKAGINYRLVNAGETVKRGQLLSLLSDYFGKPIEKVISPVNGKVLSVSEYPAMSVNGSVAWIGIGK